MLPTSLMLRGGPRREERSWRVGAVAVQIDRDGAGREVELGRGAFGVVVKGRYRLMPVAIKRLLQQSPEQQALFLKEMAILRACRGSRYIVPFVGASLQPVRRPSRARRHSADRCGLSEAEAQH